MVGTALLTIMVATIVVGLLTLSVGECARGRRCFDSGAVARANNTSSASHLLLPLSLPLFPTSPPHQTNNRAAKFKLATYVQYVPLPVVGGYLGYVGYFCLAAGIGQGSGVQIGSFSSWLNLCTQGGRGAAATL